MPVILISSLASKGNLTSSAVQWQILWTIHPGQLTADIGPGGGGGGGGGTPIWAIQGCAAQQVWLLSLRVWNRVYKLAFLSGTGYTFCHSDSGAWSGWLFCYQNRAANERCHCSRSGPTACLLKHGVSDSKVKRVSHFSVEQGIYFDDLSATG